MVRAAPHRRIAIYLDKQGVQQRFASEMSLKKSSTARAARSNTYPIWDAIRKLVKSRPDGWVKFEWIKRHQSNKGNNRAEELAGKHVVTNEYKTPKNPEEMETIRAVPFTNKRPLESTLRKTMKDSSRLQLNIQGQKLSKP